MDIDRDTAHEYRDAVKIIKTFLSGYHDDGDPENLAHNASALIARLAHNDPPLLIVYDRNVKES